MVVLFILVDDDFVLYVIEWTVVQISQMDCGPSLCPSRSIPTETTSKALMLCRHGCGSKANSMDVRFVRSPWPLPYSSHQDIIAELEDLIDTNLNINCYGDPKIYWKQRDKIESRFAVIIGFKLHCLLLN